MTATGHQLEAAGRFLLALNILSEETGLHIEDVGGYDKHLTLVPNGEKFGLFGSSGSLEWVGDHYEIATY